MTLPTPSIVAGYNRLQCFNCNNTIWRTEQIGVKYRLCGACANGGESISTCQICFEPRAGRTICYDPRSGSHLPCLTKEHCWHCTAQWIATQIDDGICDVVCPGPNCRHQIGPAIIRTLSARGLLSHEHIERLKALRNQGRRQYLQYVLSGEDAELTAWAAENTQACPHCFVLVQRSDGCAHITCTCKGEFCYICGEAYVHGQLPSSHRAHQRNDRPRLNPQGLAPPPAPRERDTATNGRTVRNASTPAAPPQSTEEARARIHALLTLQCPRCGQATCMDAGFDDCFSLRCASCPARFCAWCYRLAGDNEDPHSHVLDCAHAPEDMRGSSLYLQDHNGGPHVPPAPYNKFTRHWRAVHRRRAMELIESAGEAVDRVALVAEVDAQLAGEEEVCLPCE